MATPQELLAILGARPVAGTSLRTAGGQLPNQRQVMRPQAPTPRPIVPQGNLANTALGRMAAANPQGVAPAPVQKAGNAFMGGLGKVLGVGMKALDVLQTPQRGVLLGLEGMAKQGTLGLDSVFDMESINADKRSITDKLTDSSYSFDDLTKSTGNKFADFAINFAGDVATDPLTYVTLGSTNVAGKGARMGMAARAAEKGLGDDVVRRAAKGASFLTANEREIMGIEKAGMRFLGQRIGGEGDNIIARANAAAANALGKTTGTIRSSVTKTRPWQVISRKPEGLEQAYKVLEMGQTIGRMTPTSAASLIGWDEAYRSTMKTIVQTHAPAVADAFKGIDEAARRELTHAMENGTDATLRPFLDDLLGEARKAGVSIGDIENYMPHVWSREARGFLAGHKVTDNERAVIDLTAESGVNLTRRIRGGDLYVDGKPIDIGNGTIREINEALSKAFPDAPVERWLEDDAAELMSHYINGIASDIGEVKAFDRLLKSRAGMANPLEDVSDEVVDRVATRTANKKLRDALKEKQQIDAAAYKLEQEQARKDAVQLQAVLSEHFTKQAESLGALGQKIAASIKSRKGTASLDAQAKEIGKTVVAARKQAQSHLDALEKRWYELEEEIGAAQVRLANDATNQERLAQYNAIVKGRMALAKEIEDGKAAVAEVERLTELLLENIRMSRNIEAMMDDPDELQALAQQLVPVTTREELIPANEDNVKEIFTDAHARLAEVDRRIEALSASAADEAAAETQSLERMASSFDEALGEARQVQTEMEAAAADALRAVARNQARRGAGAPNKKISAALGDLFDELKIKDDMMSAWRQEGRDLWAARTAESVANRRASNTAAAADMFQQKGEALEQRAADIGERAFGGPSSAASEAVAQAGDREAFDKITQAAVQKHMDDAARAIKDAAMARQMTPLYREQARQNRKIISDALTPDKQPLRQLNELAEQRKAIAEARARVDEAVSQLPPSEANFMRAMDALSEAQAKVKQMEGVSRNIARQQERVARVSTPERQLAALQETRKILDRQVQANRAHRLVDFGGTRTVTEQAELPARAVLEAERAALPTTENLKPPENIRKAIEKVHIAGKKRITARDVRKGKLVPQEAINVAPRDIAKEYVALVKDMRVSSRLSDAAEQQAVVDRAVTLAEFIARYKSALDAGAEGGDALAARVTREVLDSDIATITRRHDRMAAAVDAVEDSPKRLKELKTSFADRLFDQADRYDTAVKRRQGIYHAMKQADNGQGARARRIMGMDDLEGETGARFQLTALAREAEENLKAEGMYFKDMLKILTGTYWDEESTAIRNTLRMVKPKGSDMTDKQLSGRAYAQVEKLWKSTTPEARAGLMQDMTRQVQADQRALTALRAKRTSLGHDGSPVTADWRDVLLGRQGEGTLQAKAGKLDEQLGYYAQTDEALKGARANLSRENADLQGAIKAQQPAIDRLPQAEAELAAMPKSYREKRYTDELDAMSDLIKAEGAQGRVNDQIDKVQAAMDALDPAAAKEYAAINQRKKADEFLLQSRQDWQKNVVERSAKMKANAKKVEALKPAKADVNKTFEQLDALIKEAGNSPELQPALALHAAYADRMVKLAKMDAQAGLDDAFLKAARKTAKKASKDPTKNFHNVFMREAQDGWEHVARNLMTGEDAIAVRSEIAEGLRRLKDVSENGELYKAIDSLTRFFKTYATATPGFHVRNAMSAAFMNMSDGVRFRDFTEAMREWSKFKADPKKYMDELNDPQLRAAWEATFGSGAGGAFGKGELGDKAGSSKLMHNAFTDASRRAGSAVEGVSRLAAAINSTRNGADVYGALNRVTRLHFDYSQLSKLDKKIKLMIPFWTFMSRNLPLQMQQIVMRPRLYSMYDHLRDNLSDDSLGENVPPWLMARDPILFGNADTGIGAIAPDLPHINMQEDYASLSPTNPLRALGQLNPMAVAPVEMVSNTNFYYGNKIGDGKDRLNHLASKMLPPVATAQRLGGLGRYEGKETEKRANFMGVPYYNVSPEMMQAEMRRRAYANG